MPSSSTGYHTGNGTPKNRWRVMFQSPARPLTQFSYRTRMKSGNHRSSRPRAKRSSVGGYLMNHCQLVTISSGRLPFSQNFTGCVIGLGSPTMSPDSVSISTMRCLRLRDRASGDLGPRAVGVDARWGVLDDATVASDDRPHRQPELAPPDDVGRVAERADHRDARALLGIGELVRDDRHLDVEQRRPDSAAEERLVARVVGMGDDRNARGDELGASRLDVDGFAVARLREPDAVVRAGTFAVLELGLRDRGLEVDVPESRGLRQVRVAVAQQAQERALRRAAGLRADRRVRLAPVDREADPGPQLEVGLLELLGELGAERDEVRP